MTHTPPPGDDPMAIALALEQVIRLHYSHSFCHGLKPAQWHALRYFERAEEDERTVTAFAKHRASTMGTASTTISTLVRKGYLARHYGEGVPRNRGLHLTDAGRRMLAQDPIQTMVRSLSQIPSESRRQTHEALQQLMSDLAEIEPDAPRARKSEIA